MDLGEFWFHPTPNPAPLIQQHNKHLHTVHVVQAVPPCTQPEQAVSVPGECSSDYSILRKAAFPSRSHIQVLTCPDIASFARA